MQKSIIWERSEDWFWIRIGGQSIAASRSSKSELILLQNACGEKTQEKGGSNFSQDRFLFYASTKLLLRREGGLSSYEIPLISPGKIRSTASAEKFKLGRRDPWTKENWVRGNTSWLRGGPGEGLNSQFVSAFPHIKDWIRFFATHLPISNCHLCHCNPFSLSLNRHFRVCWRVPGHNLAVFTQRRITF